MFTCMVWPLLMMVSTVLAHVMFSGASCALMGSRMSIGDCSPPMEQARLAASRSPHFAGPSGPS
jgi:hypothetical protein